MKDESIHFDLWFEDTVGHGGEAMGVWGAKHSLCDVKLKRLTFAKRGYQHKEKVKMARYRLGVRQWF